MQQLNFLRLLITNIGILKFTLKRIWRRRLNSGRDHLFCLWVFRGNKYSTFSCMSYSVLESRQMRYLLPFSFYVQSKSGFAILVDLRITIAMIYSNLACFENFNISEGLYQVERLWWKKNSKPLGKFTKTLHHRCSLGF